MQPQFVVKGRIPSKKNQKQVICMGGKPRLLPSAKYKEWHKDACIQIQQQLRTAPNQYAPETHIKTAIILLYPPDRIKADCTNKAESIMDLLVDMKIIPDDNWFEIPYVMPFFINVDRENPRAEIYLLDDGIPQKIVNALKN